MAFNIQQEGDIILENIKRQSWFPYRTGKLKFHATSGALINANTYRIKFDSTVAPYVSFLEEGTAPHDIPQAFGKPLPFGIGGRFNGKFHPGSTKHKDFIKVKCVNEIVNYIAVRFKGSVEVR